MKIEEVPTQRADVKPAPSPFYNQDEDRRTIDEVLETTVAKQDANNKFISHTIVNCDIRGRALILKRADSPDRKLRTKWPTKSVYDTIPLRRRW